MTIRQRFHPSLWAPHPYCYILRWNGSSVLQVGSKPLKWRDCITSIVSGKCIFTLLSVQYHYNFEILQDTECSDPVASLEPQWKWSWWNWYVPFNPPPVTYGQSWVDIKTFSPHSELELSFNLIFGYPRSMITVFPLLRIRITSGEELYRWNLIEPMFFLMVAVKKRNLPANNIVISTMLNWIVQYLNVAITYRFLVDLQEIDFFLGILLAIYLALDISNQTP